MQVVVDSLLTSYETAGQGRLILLLHGWGDRASGLRGLAAALAKDFCVIAVDLPGFGSTQAPDGVWGLDEYAAFVAHFLQKIDAGTPRVIAGHSNGGAIAIRGLANGVFMADKLVLLASAGIRGEQKGRLRAWATLAKAGKLAAAPLPARAKARLRQKLYNAAGSDMLVAEQLEDTFRRVIGEDVRADAAQLKLPTLLMYGDRDTSTPVRYGLLYQGIIKGSMLKVLPGAGHFVHLDRPAEVAAAILEFAR